MSNKTQSILVQIIYCNDRNKTVLEFFVFCYVYILLVHFNFPVLDVNFARLQIKHTLAHLCKLLFCKTTKQISTKSMPNIAFTFYVQNVYLIIIYSISMCEWHIRHSGHTFISIENLGGFG